MQQLTCWKTFSVISVNTKIIPEICFLFDFDLRFSLLLLNLYYVHLNTGFEPMIKSQP